MQTLHAAEVEAYVASVLMGHMSLEQHSAMRALEDAATELDVRLADLAALLVAASSRMPTDQLPGPGADPLGNQPGIHPQETGRPS